VDKHTWLNTLYKRHEEMYQELKEVLACLNQAGMKLCLYKCSFSQPSVIFLGHKISAQGVELVREKVLALLDISTPKNVKDVCAFMGLVSYYHHFVKNCL